MLASSSTSIAVTSITRETNESIVRYSVPSALDMFVMSGTSQLLGTLFMQLPESHGFQEIFLYGAMTPEIENLGQRAVSFLSTIYEEDHRQTPFLGS